MAPQNKNPYVPRFKEVAGKVRKAIKALENGFYEIIDDSQDDRSFKALGVSTRVEILEHVLEFLGEILPDAFGNFCGIGKRGMVEFSTKSGFTDVRLYAFCWDSQKMGKKMYLKFGIRERGSKTVFTYMHLSCHEHEQD
jgi:hypothetical protein